MKCAYPGCGKPKMDHGADTGHWFERRSPVDVETERLVLRRFCRWLEEQGDSPDDVPYGATVIWATKYLEREA